MAVYYKYYIMWSGVISVKDTVVVAVTVPGAAKSGVSTSFEAL